MIKFDLFLKLCCIDTSFKTEYYNKTIIPIIGCNWQFDRSQKKKNVDGDIELTVTC